MSLPSYLDIIYDYWKYYKLLENQLFETERYVEFDYINNGKTYSMEYLKLFQAVCSEIDVVGKALASYIDHSFKPTKNTGINEWWFHITQEYPELQEKECPFLDIYKIQPWKNFYVRANPNEKGKKYILDDLSYHKAKTPFWWNDYNSVKHNRTGKFEKHSTNYAKANLKNLFYSFAALYSLEVLFIKLSFLGEEGTLSIGMESKLFDETHPFYTKLLATKG